MHMAHKSGNTSGVLKLSSDWLNYTGFPGDVCVVFYNVPPGNKDAVTPNLLTKEESRRVYNCDDERLSVSTKRWIFKSMWNIQSSWRRIFKICPRGLHTCLLLWRHVHAPKRDAQRNELWSVVWHVGQTGRMTDVSNNRSQFGQPLASVTHGQPLANESCHGFQTFSHQSEVLATQD